jgi:hypothetical protein
VVLVFEGNRWWRSLSTADALRLDYKQFTLQDQGGSVEYGISSILLPMHGAPKLPMLPLPPPPFSPWTLKCRE